MNSLGNMIADINIRANIMMALTIIAVTLAYIALRMFDKDHPSSKSKSRSR